MHWLNELERDFKYRCQNGHLSLYRMLNNTPEEVTRAGTTCTECGEAAEYVGFAEIKIGQTGRVMNEQNGRYYYEIRRPDGSIARVSKTKMDYINSFGDPNNVDPKTGKKACAKITPAYTPAYREHLKKIGRSDLLQEAFIDEKARKPASGSATLVKTKGA